MIQDRLLLLREDKEWTQTYVARQLNISQRAYSHYENGTRQLPLDILKQLSILYSVSTDYILELTDQKEIFYSPAVCPQHIKALVHAGKIK